MIDAGRADCVVVIGADFMSRVVDPEDRGTSAVFADGAGAVVLVATGESRIGPIVLGSEGDTDGHHPRRPRRTQLIRMVGHETFKIAVAKLSEATEQAVAAAGRRARRDRPVRLPPGQRAASSPPSASASACEPTASSTASATLGNTSAATLPLALDHSVEAGACATGDRVLLGRLRRRLHLGRDRSRMGRGRMSAVLSKTDA